MNWLQMISAILAVVVCSVSCCSRWLKYFVIGMCLAQLPAMPSPFTRTDDRRLTHNRYGLGRGYCQWCNKWRRRWLTWCNYCDSGPYCLGDCAKDHARYSLCYNGGRIKAIASSAGRSASGACWTSVGSGHRGEDRNSQMQDGAASWPSATAADADGGVEVAGTRSQHRGSWFCVHEACSAATHLGRPNYGHRSECRKCGACRP